MKGRTPRPALWIAGLFVAAALLSHAATTETWDESLIGFYTEHLENLAQADGEKIRERLLFILPRDSESKQIFVKHRDLAANEVAARKAELKGLSLEQLREIKMDTLKHPTGASIKVFKEPNFTLARELDGGVDPNTRSRDDYNKPLLFRAVRRRASDSVALLLKRGARVDERSATFHKTALFQAAYDGSTAIVKFLLDSQADPNALDRYGNNALREAIVAKHPEIVKLLLERGANPNQVNKDGESMKALAEKHGTPKIRAIIEEHIR